jgi:3-phosphoshikimate 1-carboxyvinyltransferase
MGADIRPAGNDLRINGPSDLHGAVIESKGDHRIAMAFAVAGLVATGTTTVKRSSCVNISYPQFWEDLRKLTSAASQIHEAK